MTLQKAISVAAAAAMLLLTGCVSVTTPANYRPQSETLTQDYYDCDRASTGTVSAVSWNKYGGAGVSGSQTTPHLLVECMQARGYQVRKATEGEVIAYLVTAPIWLPLEIMVGFAGADTYMIGGGSAED